MEYYGQTPQRIKAALERVRSQIEAATITEPAEFWAQMQPLLADEPFALCALDQAAHDLWGKRRGQLVYKLWGLSLGNCPASDYTIGIDPIERMVMKLNEFPGWPIYKIKLGTEHDLAIVAELRKHTDATFRVDANCGWTADQTLRNAPELAKLNVQFIEQPLAYGQWEGYRRLRQESALPIIADESCLVEADVERCSGYFHGVNIKLSKAGGMTPARRMIHTARRLGLKVMMGCMTESSVGISAIAQFLPLLDYVDMDGAVLLAKDAATGVRLERGRAIFPDENGNGVRLLDR
jgi:L-alanine-DL-glutamate epimerase-like enolase superfamily enzyme